MQIDAGRTDFSQPPRSDLGSSLEGVHVLWMARCGLSDFSGPSALASLRELYLAFNNLCDISSLSMLEHLEILDLEGCDIKQCGLVRSGGAPEPLRGSGLADAARQPRPNAEEGTGRRARGTSAVGLRPRGGRRNVQDERPAAASTVAVPGRRARHGREPRGRARGRARLAGAVGAK
ncbi:MAG: hypothetical protein BJ554DRAFT_4795 [Olpidium bornovanus]|uniref:Leucine-rich repeat-containing protein 56 n=1 Tax=Olpidium bornovanus TaxID=278681 RepID=A0A8H7ZMA4_9FUNG|nr:MAG: hypothetical protein BJ554DRAFT_4795 [Olpidium bornovanus]